MAIGGNRFGNSWGSGGMDALDRLKMRRMLMGGLRTGATVSRAMPNQAQAGGGSYPARMLGSMTSGGGDESFNKRKELKMRYGKFNYRTGQYEGGAERDIQKSKSDALRYGADKNAESRKYRADKDFEARKNRTAMEREWRAREHKSRWNTDTFAGEQPGTEIRNSRAREIQAEAARQQAQAAGIKARQGLAKPQKYISGTEEKFAYPDVDQQGRPVMRGMEVLPSQQAVPQAPSQIPAAPRTQKGKNKQHWRDWL